MYQFNGELMKRVIEKFVIIVALSLTQLTVVGSSQASVLGKPGLPVYVSGSSIFQFALSETKKFEITLDVSRFKTGTLTVAMRPDDGYVFNNNKNTYAYTLDANQSTVSLPVSITANQAGRFYLTLSTQWQDDEKPVQYKTLGVVIQVGEDLSRQKLQLQSSEANTGVDRIKALPAEETVY